MNMEMMNNRPITRTNAKNIEETSLAVIGFPYLRYDSIADFYTEQPQDVRVKIEEDREYLNFKQVFRVRIWQKNDKTRAYSIYSNTSDVKDEENAGIILRYSEWDKGADQLVIKNTGKDGMKVLAHNWPKLYSTLFYYSTKNKDWISNLIVDFDQVITTANPPTKREKIVDYKLTEYEIMRLFNWGQIHYVWAFNMSHEILEEKIRNFFSILDNTDDNSGEEVYKMQQDYTVPLEVFKDIVCGDLKENH